MKRAWTWSVYTWCPPFGWAEEECAATWGRAATRWRAAARLGPTLHVRQQARQVVARVGLLELGEDLPNYVILNRDIPGI